MSAVAPHRPHGSSACSSGQMTILGWWHRGLLPPLYLPTWSKWFVIHSKGQGEGNFRPRHSFVYMQCLHVSSPEFSLTLTLLLERLNSSFISTDLFKVLNLLKPKENIHVKQEDSMTSLKFLLLWLGRSTHFMSAWNMLVQPRVRTLPAERI